MKREIKFRVYDKILGDFLPDFSFSINTVGEILIDDKVIDGQNDYVIQQYIGYNDNNGLEIYEGDIVDFISGVIGDIGQIKWHNFGFIIEYGRKGAIYNTFIVPSQLKVIGNIFENKDLIKK